MNLTWNHSIQDKAVDFKPVTTPCHCPLNEAKSHTLSSRSPCTTMGGAYKQWRTA